MCILCRVEIRSHIRSVRIGDDERDKDADGAGSDGELDFDDAAVQWPAKPADYDSDYDFQNFDAPDEPDTVEKFSAGEYVCLMVPGDKQAYARFKVQNQVDLTVTALIKSPCGLVQFGPGVYALVEFVGTMSGVITI